MPMRARSWSRTCSRATPRKASVPWSKSDHRLGKTADLSLARPSPYVPGPRTEPMNHESYADPYIRGILNTVKTIAMVGFSPKENRPSYFAFKYLLERGYNMIPVNPGQAGKEILGRRVYAKLGDIPEPVDMVDVFRAAKYA